MIICMFRHCNIDVLTYPINVCTHTLHLDIVCCSSLTTALLPVSLDMAPTEVQSICID